MIRFMLLALALSSCTAAELDRADPRVPNSSYPCTDARPWVRRDPTTGEIHCTARPFDMRDFDVDATNPW